MTTFTLNEKSLELHYATFTFSGYGHKKVTVELYYNGEYKKFTATTDRVDLTDDASELEGDERYLALYQIIDWRIEHEVSEWIEELDKN